MEYAINHTENKSKGKRTKTNVLTRASKVT